jgi:outer membrane protein TolC
MRRPLRTLNFEGAVELALKNYPAIRAAHARRRAAEAGVDLARTNYLPRDDMIRGQNHATRNNVSACCRRERESLRFQGRRPTIP